MKIAQGSKLLMIGDSITDCGRAGMPAEGGDNLGRGYVQLVDALLGAVYPDLKIRVANAGISGNRARDLAERWQRDVLDQKPDWLSIMIGANDVWRQFDRFRQPEMHVLPEEYEQTVGDLVAKTRPALKGMVMMSPFFLDPDAEEPMRRRMDQYGQIIRKIASSHDAIFVDTQAAFNTVLRHLHTFALSGDRVHPNQVGHMVLARAFLNALGFDWSRSLS